MVLKKISEYIERKREQRAEGIIENQKLATYRDTENMKAAEQLRKEADRLVHLKQYRPAIQEYFNALEIYPYNEKELIFKKSAEHFFKMYFNIAATYSYLHNLTDSLEYFDKALKIKNIDEENKVKALMAKGNSYYLAKQTVKQELHLDKKSLEALKKIDEKKDFIKHAHECFRTATEINKNSPEAWYKKGHMEFLMDFVKDAMLSFDTVLMLQKDFQNTDGISLFEEIRKEKGIDQGNESNSKFKTKTGHMVANKAEMIIANFLFENNIMFQYDMSVAWADDDNFRASFFLPKLDLYLEHFKHSQAKLMKRKIRQYEKNKKKLVFTTSDDEKNIEESLKIKLKPYIML